jgi:hypothetical protein
MLLLFMLPCMLLLFEFMFEFMFEFVFMFEFMFEFIFEFMFEFMFEFVLMFELFAFPLALSAGVHAVQTQATARRVRSASVLRIEFPPVPLGVRLLGSCAGLSLAFTPRAFSLQLGQLMLR